MNKNLTSDAMQQALADILHKGDSTYADDVQAVINAAWTKFDYEDPSIWPNSNTTFLWLTHDREVQQDTLHYLRVNDWLHNVSHYAEIENLLPERKY